MHNKSYKLAVDTGETFTDICLVHGDTGELAIHKTPSTPEEPYSAVIDGLEFICRGTGINLQDIDFLLYGTTAAANTIRKVGEETTALVTTAGFKDILYLGRQNRPHPFNIKIPPGIPLIHRHLTFEAAERMDPGGTPLKELNREEARKTAEAIKKAGVKSAAVCFLHSYANPEHEKQMAEIIKETVPGIFVTISSDLSSEQGEYERANTAVINALLQPLIHSHLGTLQKRLNEKGFSGSLYIMQSNGGFTSATRALKQSACTAFSSPAAGVLAGEYISRLTGRKNIITMDMGGTSSDICLFKDSGACRAGKGYVYGQPLKMPAMDIHTTAAGGESIAYVVAGGELKVGPESTTSLTGPASCHKGDNKPTVTDAHIVLGRLSPETLSKYMQPDPGAAHRNIEKHIAVPLGLDVESAAEGIIKITNARIVNSMRLLSVEKGFDPGDFTLVSFGGAGPLHAVEIASELGLPYILIPPYPGATAAYGMLCADIRRDYMQKYTDNLEEVDPASLNKTYERLENKALNNLADEGITGKNVSLSRFIDLRYAGQSYDITMEMPSGSLIHGDLKLLKRTFHKHHSREYGFSRDGESVKITALRLTVQGKLPFSNSPEKDRGYRNPTPREHRTVIFNNEQIKTPVYERSIIAPGAFIKGPAVIEQKDSTILLWSRNTAHCDKWDNLIISLEG